VRSDLTFSDSAQICGLAIGENSFHVDPHIAARTIGTANDTEAESLVPRTLEKSSSQYREGCAALTGSWQGTEPRLFAFSGLVDVLEFRVGIQTLVRILGTLKGKSHAIVNENRNSRGRLRGYRPKHAYFTKDGFYKYQKAIDYHRCYQITLNP
jgi:hypothetical protein